MFANNLIEGSSGELERLQHNIAMLCDSQCAIHLDKCPTYHSKTKHIDIKYHFLRQVIDGGGVDIKKIHTQENYAYMFMKQVTLEKL